MPDVRRVPAAAVLPLRHRVLRPGRPPESANLPGDDLSDTHHFAAYDAGELIGCATFLSSSLDGEPAWQLRGMATSPERQGQGVGRLLLDRATAELISASGVRLFWCNARTGARPFYERLGWTVISGEFPIEGVGPHFKMSWHAV